MKNTINLLGSSKNFERAINLALIATALLFVGLLCKTLLARRNSPNVSPPVESGTKLEWENVDWARAGQTLVLALSTDCRFCSESAPFYRRLVKGLSDKGGTRVFAVLPQTIKEGQDYLNGLGFSVDEVRQMELAPLGLKGTPTILLVDGAGVVKEVLTGKLGTQQELALFERLQLKEERDRSDEDRSSIFLDAASVRQNMHREDFVVVDVENRDVFNFKHIDGAVNIPDDELEVRALNELRPTDTIVVYCHYCEADIIGEVARDVLRRNGFERVFILREGLKAWELEGQPKKEPAN